MAISRSEYQGETGGKLPKGLSCAWHEKEGVGYVVFIVHDDRDTYARMVTERPDVMRLVVKHANMYLNLIPSGDEK